MKYLNRVTILLLVISFSGVSLSCEQIDSKRLAEVRKAFAEISDENNLAVNMNSHALDLFFRDKERYKDVINELFLFSAHLGDRRGQFNLGRKIYEGNDIEVDKDKGLCWLKKSAEQDTPQALFYLGNVYVSKKEDKEIKKGNEYFFRAEKMGYSPALCSLGLSYLLGIGLEKDSSKAIRYFEESVYAGDQKCATNLILLNINGKELPIDYCAAKKWMNFPYDVESVGASNIILVEEKSVDCLEDNM